MRLLGWLASGLGIAGIVASSGLVPLVWIARRNVLDRIRGLLAIPDGGLIIGDGLVRLVEDRVRQLDAEVATIGDAAHRVAAAPAPDPTDAITLATTIRTFVAGPYAELRNGYGRLRERGLAAGEALAGLTSAIPFLGIVDVAAERLQALDARFTDIDVAVTALAATGPELLADPSIAGRVAERADQTRQSLARIDALLGELATRMEDARDGLADRDVQMTRALTIGAIAGSLLALFGAFLHALLYQQGRRWSGRS